MNQQSNISKILDGLNEQQKKAVTTIEGPLLVIAGAGSGKTRVLTNRIAYLIEQGIPPWSILALTFTNKAANEMKERIAAIVSDDNAYKVWAGTFHSIFARILRTEAQNIGFSSSFSIYDTDDSMSLIRNVMNNLGISQQHYPPQAMRGRISWAKNQMVNWTTYRDSADSLLEKITAQVFEAYQKSLFENNAMDFDDLLLYMIKLLESSESVLEKYQERFQYILVDEYQDTNKAQYIAIKLLAKKNKNICVVGDDAQSIYRWRGAEIKNILDFQKDYPKVAVVPLEQNYRSTKNILSAADSVIKKNKRQIPKTLWTNNNEGELIDVVVSPNDRDEADTIASNILRIMENEKRNESDFAILYRTNAQSLALENSLRANRLPYIVIGGTSFYQRKEVKDTLAYLRITVNSKDSESILRVINEPPRGIGNTSISHVKNYAQKKQITLFDALQRVDEIDELQMRAKNAIKSFIGLISKNVDSMNLTKPEEFVKQYIAETGILQMYREINTDEALDRWNNIQQLISDMTQFFKNNENQLLDDYLQQITLITDIDQKDTSKNQVKLMTIHAAKGLEFPVVFISGLEQGLFPLAKAEFVQEEEEEERRLFYVGITRAKSRLFLTYADKRLRFGEFTSQSPSHFLKDIDERYLKSKPFVFGNTVQSHSARMNFAPKSKYDSIMLSQKTNVSDDAFGLKIGDKVMHAHFGKGKIMVLSGTGSNSKAVVNFDSVGKKVLMLQFAKLEKV